MPCRESQRRACPAESIHAKFYRAAGGCRRAYRAARAPGEPSWTTELWRGTVLHIWLFPMDYSLIQGTVASLKAASDLARGFLDLKSIADVQGRVIELQSVILSAQTDALAANSQQSAMAEDIRKLRQQIADMEAWAAERERYALTALEPGIFVYALMKDAAARGEPPHWLCAHCFGTGAKVVLQSEGDWYGATEHHCPSCKLKIKVKSSVVPNF